MLEVSHLTKRYGDKIAIEDIHFTVSQGEIVGLLGHNGSGKSTTMNIIAGCLSATSGSVRIDGSDIVESSSEAKSKIGYLPENPPLYPDMTVNEQLIFAANLRRIPKQKREEAIALACEQVNIRGVRRRLIKNLSKGYRQRVGFAQALLGEPELLILDEPTVGLDPRQIIEIRETIAGLGKTHTIILSSHILSEIAAVCKRVVVLSNGRLVADDLPSKLVAKMSPEGKLVLRADGTPEQITAAVRAVTGIKSCTLQVSPEDGQVEFILETQSGEDIHRSLFFVLAEAQCPIRLLKPLETSLEDVFLQLTQDRRYEEAN